MSDSNKRQILLAWPCNALIFILFWVLSLTANALTVTVEGSIEVNSEANIVAVTNYRWLIEEDATYHIIPGQTCNNGQLSECLGANFHRSNMPVIAEGHSGDLFPVLDPNKHYFISILPDLPANPADTSFSMAGAQIKPGQENVTVRVNAQPFPTAQIVVYVFNDNNPINGAPDQPQEEVPANDPVGMAGFHITLEDGCGHYGVCAGQQTTDVYGNPLGTTYDAAGNVTSLGNGQILTDREGYAVIKNLAPGKYGIQAVPPTGANWHQTSTIEGTKIIDAWVKANEPGYFAEWGPPGPHVFIGFVRQFTDNTVLTGGATISGQVRSIHNSRPPDFTFFTGEPVGGCWVGLNVGTGAAGRAVYAAPCNADSTFAVPNVPAGNYTLTIWDEPLLYLITSYNITVSAVGGVPQDVALLDVPIFAWFHTIEQKVFFDTNENGIMDAGEVGMPDQGTNVRWRDGSIYQSIPTDTTGSAPYEEMFPWFNWMVAEVNFDRFKATGMTAHVDAGGPVEPGNALNEAYGPYTQTSLEAGGPVLLEAFQGFAGQTTVIEWGKANYKPGENGGITGIVYYDTTRAEQEARYNAAEAWQPGIPRMQVALYRDTNRDNLADDLNADGVITVADVDNYPFDNFPGTEDYDYNANGVFDLGDALAVTHTDSWDDSKPSGCNPDTYGNHFTVDPGTPYATTLDCYDGLRNFNQVRPGVFDGGYGFFTLPNAAGVDAPIPPGNYIVAVGQHPVYKIVKEEDQNVAFGDAFAVPQALPPLCAGDDHLVPSHFSLFPLMENGAEVAPPKAGQTIKLCDRKVVTVANGRNAAADFFMFTNVPITGHITGFILDDVSNEFDPNSPAFGEKYSPPFIPISIRDWKGHEFARTYSDRWGNFNAIVPSTYNINVPAPSGVGPNMITTCMNDPGPIPNPNGSGMITDPFYKKQYSQFCYTFPYIPGETHYLDTPVVPVAAFAGPDQFALDCEFPDQTPIIWSVTGPTVAGPYVTAAGQTITITSVGNKEIQNPLFGAAGQPQTISRDYGFGPTKGSITFNGVAVAAADILTWNNDVITVRVPASFVNVATGRGTAQMLITRDQGLTTRTGITVTVGGRYVTVPVNGSISATIRAARPGDLVLVPVGDFDEMVIMGKPVRLQGAGAGSHINPVNIPGEKLTKWFADVQALVDAGAVSLLPGQNAGFGGIEPATLFTEAGAGVIVMGKAPGTGAPQFNNEGNKSRIDGLTIAGSDNGGGIVVNGYADWLDISNNHIYSNFGVYGGGIRLGHPEFNPPENANANISIHHNDVSANGATFGAGGGISLYTGARNYNVDRNWVCGNFTGSDGGGIAHLGLSRNGKITNNAVIHNQSFQQTNNVDGGGIYISGVPGTGAALTAGSGHVDIVSNLIQGNNAGAGMGAGIALHYINGTDAARAFGQWWNIDIINNMIVNNVAGYTGGGISLQDALKVRLINNTIARNESTATSGNTFCNTLVVPAVCDPNTSTPYAAGVVSFKHAQAFVLGGNANQRARYGVFSNPTMINNILWENRMSHFAIDNTIDPPTYGLFTDAVGGVGVDTRVYGTPGVLAGPGTDSSNNLYTGANVNFVLPYFNANPGETINQNEFTTTIQANPAFDEGGNFINVRYGPLYMYGDYHLQAGSAAINTGNNAVLGEYPATSLDFDGQIRPRNLLVDVGADEF
ncbi:MAG: hypothetical protein HY080_10870 [Gammaproteobacteria bacterium]|nr:hypothetical protein [Gammaproteobacteria bacterium]